MDLMPILSTLRRHKTAAGLIVLEVALSSAIVCNALHLITERLTLLNADNGLAEAELVVLDVGGIGVIPNVDEITSQDLQALRALPGVKSATIINTPLYGESNQHSSVSMDAAQKDQRFGAATFSVEADGVRTLGLKLIAGRDFRPEEVVLDNDLNNPEKQVTVGQVIINRKVAERLYPGKSALGEQFYVFGDTPVQVIGVAETLTPVHPSSARAGDDYAMMFPIRNSFRGGAYVLRVEPSQQDAVIKAASAALERVDGNRIIKGGRPMSEMRAKYYAQDRAMVWLLGGVCAALLIVTAFGIVGLASFWVQQRTRMIGTRRALGATRGQILRYFQAENFLLSSAGIVIGMVAAYGISLLLMQSYEMPRLPWSYLPMGALVLWALGQLAVLAPARRAAALPPVAALRS